MHFLRFEIDRTKFVTTIVNGERKSIANKDEGKMRITDIDCFLNGNRHLVRN